MSVSFKEFGGFMIIKNTDFPGLKIIELDKFSDERGAFFETYQQKRYQEQGLASVFVQDNQSCSKANVLRGLHYQKDQAQAKLVWVVQGQVLDVAVDVRVGSPTFGNVFKMILSEDEAKQVFIPEGFAHGFSVLSPQAIFCYKCTHYYDKASERGIIWSDPELGIDWQISSPIISDKDQTYPRLTEISENELPRFQAI
jgi:dTDP-4-dehydrorhamnose 3,5-epimerase